MKTVPLARGITCSLLLLLLLGATRLQAEKLGKTKAKPARAAAAESTRTAESSAAPRVIHVFIALCDNASQGIIPVPAKIGDGNNPDANLYWGCDEGFWGVFGKSRTWKVVELKSDVDAKVLRRACLYDSGRNAYLIVEAYRGSEIRTCINEFLLAATSEHPRRFEFSAKDGGAIKLSGGSDAGLVAYIGHDGLMEFAPDLRGAKPDKRPTDAIVLACKSRDFFGPHLAGGSARPRLMTTQLMYPGAFLLCDAVAGWLDHETNAQLRERAGKAYAANQGISKKAALGVFALIED